MQNIHTGKTIRLGRILNQETGRAAVVAFDHGVHLGVVPGILQPVSMLQTLTEAGADAFLVGPGLARHAADVFSGRNAPALILRLDWTNRWRDESMLGAPEGRTRLLASVEDAVRMGADAVLMYLFLGYEDPDAEAQQAETVAQVVQACDRWGMGCFIEPMPRGKRVGSDIYKPEYVAMGARIACEMGADVLKTDYTGDSESFKTVVEASFRPILIAGGPKTETDQEALEMVRGAMDAGANGMFIGRNVFQSANPAAMMRAYTRIIHEGITAEAAAEELG